MSEDPKFKGWKILFLLITVGTTYSVERVISSVYIDTDSRLIEVTDENNLISKIQGRYEKGNFTCRNNRTWPFEKTVFDLALTNADIFHNRNTNVTITGSRALELNVPADLYVNHSLILDGIPAKVWNKPTFLGAFLPNISRCCYVGAGPGAGFTFHGGGHGGSGGGSWKDSRSGLYYGFEYNDYAALAGGSTGSLIYDSDPGSGGGAIAVNVEGTLTIAPEVKISANGYSVQATSHPACAGGSAGGKIILRAQKAIISGCLEASGGNSGFTSNYSYYCGDGGGGGLIYVHAYEINMTTPCTNVEGGKGLVQGSIGKIFSGANFLLGQVTVNTTECTLTASDFPIKLRGILSVNAEACRLSFATSLLIGAEAQVTILGHRALVIKAREDITISSSLLLQQGAACPLHAHSTCLGGFNNVLGSSGPGTSSDYAAHGNVTRPKHYGISDDKAFGGSSCSGKQGKAVGGGFIQLETSGNIFIDASITADAWSEDGKNGASGGTIILVSNQVTFGPKAHLSAKGVDGEVCKGDGGIIFVHQRSKKTGYTRPSFDVAGGANGLSGLMMDPIYCGLRACNNTWFEMQEVVTSKITQYKETILPSESISNILTTMTESEGFQTIYKTLAVMPTKSFSTATSTQIVPVADEELSEKFKPLKNVTVTQNNGQNVVLEVNAALKETTTLNEADVRLSMKVLRNATDENIYSPRTKNESEVSAKVIMESMDLIVTANAEHRIKESRKDLFMDVAMYCITMLENYGKSVAKTLAKNDLFKVSTNDLHIVVRKTEISKPEDIVISGIGGDTTKGSPHQILLPKTLTELLPHGNPAVVTSVLLNSSKVYRRSRTLDNNDVSIGSQIMAVSVHAKLPELLKDPVKLRFKLNTKLHSNDTARVGFWSQQSMNSSLHGWSYKGCKSHYRDGVVTAECNHMTSFGVLVQVTKTEISKAHVIALDIITYIGCGISLFGLLLTFGTFVSLESLDAERAAIHTNLVISLGIAQVIFLSGIEATHNRVACTAVAILLHYFFVAAFAWMFAEGLHLYNKVVSVFTQGSKIKFYCVLGWGLPVILVSTSAGIRPDGYGRSDACWISIKDGLIWAFVIPVLLVIVANLGILVIVVRILMVSISNANSEQRKRLTQIKSGIKAVGILVPILGLTWVFGIMAVNEKTVALQYLFCILNSFQGLFIFMIHCVGNSEVRAAFRRLHEKHTLSNSVGGKSSAHRHISGSVVVKRQLASPSGDKKSGGNIDDNGSLSGNDSPKFWKASTDEISLHSLHCPDAAFK